MRNNILNKFISLILCLCILAFCTVTGFAKSQNKTDYPFIYVHGMCGWGDGSPVSLRDLLPRFTLDTIPHAPFVICYNHRLVQEKECAGA